MIVHYYSELTDPLGSTFDLINTFHAYRKERRTQP